jgi:hypothetical protein
MLNVTQKGCAAPPFALDAGKCVLYRPLFSQADDFFVALMIKRKRNTVKMPYNALDPPGKLSECLSSP